MKNRNTPVLIMQNYQANPSHDSLFNSSDNTLHTSQIDCACSETIGFYTQNHSKNKTIAPNEALFSNDAIQLLPVNSDYSVAISENSQFSVLNTAAVALWQQFKQADGHAVPVNSRNSVDWQVVKTMLEGRLLLRQGDKVSSKIISDELSAWLHITDRCNLRCDYCYLPHDKVDMSWDTAKAAVDSIIRAAHEGGYKQIKLKIAGGEPLLKFELVQRVLGYAKAETKRHQLILDAVVLSNGTLMDLAKAHILKQLGARVMISLDGLHEVHDCQRKYIGGKGSFQQVENTLDILQTLAIPIDISITVSSKNAHGLADLVDYLLQRDLFFAFSFYRENDLSQGDKALRLETQTIIDGLMAAYKIIENYLPNYNLLASLADRANLSQAHKQTCSASNSYLVYTPEGNISQCQMQLDKPVASVHTIQPLEAIRSDQSLVNLSVDEKQGCNTCNWKYWCAGGCPIETHRVTGRYDVKSPNCEIYKAIFPEVVRLEALRMIKCHD